MRNDIVALVSDLVAIDSVNPSLVPGGAGEREIAAFVSAWARAAGLDAQTLEATAGRPSVIVRARGRGGGRTLLLCGHLDTVSTEGPGITPRLDGDDRLHGRGTYDMKAGLAAALLACREAARHDLAGDVIVAAVADEEHASQGIQEALEAIEADAAIVTEPTELALAIAHKGFVWSEIEVTGRAARGSRPHLGVDAILKTGPILTALDPDAELVRLVGDVLGPDANAGGVSYWADSAFIAAAGIPTVLLGPVGAGAHAAEEWVSVGSTATLTRALIEIATRFSGPSAAPRT